MSTDYGVTRESYIDALRDEIADAKAKARGDKNTITEAQAELDRVLAEPVPDPEAAQE